MDAVRFQGLGAILDWLTTRLDFKSFESRWLIEVPRVDSLRSGCHEIQYNKKVLFHLRSNAFY